MKLFALLALTFSLLASVLADDKPLPKDVVGFYLWATGQTIIVSGYNIIRREFDAKDEAALASLFDVSL